MEILREWWYAAESGPETLFWIRLGVGAILLFAVLMAVWAVVRPPEREGTWDAAQYKRARFMNVWRVLGLLLLLTYVLTAGVLEAERTSSPHRLIFANIAQAITGGWQLFDMIFWRWHYARKPAELKQRGLTMNSNKRSA
ncbi:hypothetical protein [Deinococcus humi]|uniref:Uncharacterized protein n=1 Tax=Deinococcus humi TaxID=662880 RepID=A0A7W8JR43_9DEIO|nr:hypothetical protein [Deinococcus humi]MBB5361313.1 hypothetical protein [Deinococcus humi]GGO19439.1 hypothetical protein GCM10008949_03790 [Deinococcus humi]